MASTNKTTNYSLPQWVGSDKPTYLGDFNDAFSKIDTQMKSNNDTAAAANTKANSAIEYTKEPLDNKVTNFTEAEERTNIESGETTKVIFGKIKKFFSTLKSGAFASVVNNLTTATPGSVLDASQGYILKSEVDAVSQSVAGKADKLSRDAIKGTMYGTFVKFNFDGLTSVILNTGIDTDKDITVEYLNNYFGTNYSTKEAKTKFIAVCMNGDADASAVHFSGCQWIGSSIVAVSENSLKGETFRCNWLIFHVQ